MSLVSTLNKRRIRRALRVRAAMKAASCGTRVTVFRSLQQLYGQIIDEAAGKTVAAASTAQLDKQVKGDKKARAKAAGLELAKKAKSLGIERVTFDRGRFAYHGRVAAFADGLREGGLQF